MKPITELLDVRGSNYSHRPNYLVAGQLGTVNQSTPLMSYGEQWRLHRRLSKPALNVVAVKKYWPLEQQCATLMCKSLLDSPDDFFEHVRMYAISSSLSEYLGQLISCFAHEMMTVIPVGPRAELFCPSHTAYRFPRSIPTSRRPGRPCIELANRSYQVPIWPIWSIFCHGVRAPLT